MSKPDKESYGIVTTKLGQDAEFESSVENDSPRRNSPQYSPHPQSDNEENKTSLEMAELNDQRSSSAPIDIDDLEMGFAGAGTEKPKHTHMNKVPSVSQITMQRSSSVKTLATGKSLDFLTDEDFQNSKSSENEDADWPHFDPMDKCYPWFVYKKDYIQVKNEILAGIVCVFAHIPEAIAFAILGGLPPAEGLQATWIVSMITSLFGGRTTMISGATSAIGAVLGSIDGQMYKYPAITLAGVMITMVGVLKWTKYTRLIPHPAMVGFLNGLAVIIAHSQLHTFEHTHGVELWLMILVSIIVGLIVYYLPRYTKAIPSSLAGILVALLIEYALFQAIFGIHTKTIGDLGNLKSGFPTLMWYKYSEIPEFSGETMQRILMPSLYIALVAISEDVLAVEVVSEMTNTKPKSLIAAEHMVRQQIIAMGISNIISGLCATMGGGGAIGISIISCFQGSNGKYRIAAVTHAFFLFFVVVFLYKAIEAVPAAALVGIIACTVYHTFEWHSIMILITTMLPLKARKYLQQTCYKKSMRKIQRADAAVILIVTVLTLTTNLGVAIMSGLIISALVYSWQSSNHLTVEIEYVHMLTIKEEEEHEIGDKEKSISLTVKHKNKWSGKNVMKIYHIEGPLFFGNAKSIVNEFTPEEDPDEVEMHLRDANMYDFSAINALNEVAQKYRRLGKSVHLKHVRDKSHKLIAKAHHLITNFTYDTMSIAEDRGRFSLKAPDRFHIAQYPM